MPATMGRKDREAIRVEMLVIDGIDPSNHGEDTVVDITVYSDMKLKEVHDCLLKILQVEESTIPYLHYYFSNMDEPVDLSLSLREIGVQEGDRIVADASRKKRKFRNDDSQIEAEDSEDDLTVICYTRIFEADGVPMKKLKVLVRSQQSCGTMIEDVCRIWNRDNLKFRYGRHVLTSEKTFMDVAMVDGGEILVTGARG